VSSLRWCHLGRVGYDAARALQSRLANDRAAGACGDVILLLEHPPVLTIGRNAAAPLGTALPVVRTDRGGNVTYHGPGQLVGYPVVALRAAGRGVRAFVARLEEALCDTAAAFGVAAHVRPGLPGVWTSPDRKLASIGLAVRRGVTLHGCALNVASSAETGFDGLDPCGLPGVRVTSLVGAGARADLATADAAPVLAASLARRLGLAAEPCRIDDLLPGASLSTITTTTVAAPPAPLPECHGHQPAS
jgi:lipoyl(octanoyl) transferase